MCRSAEQSGANSFAENGIFNHDQVALFVREISVDPVSDGMVAMNPWAELKEFCVKLIRTLNVLICLIRCDGIK